MLVFKRSFGKGVVVFGKRNGEKGKQDTEFAQQTFIKHSANTEEHRSGNGVVSGETAYLMVTDSLHISDRCAYMFFKPSKF